MMDRSSISVSGPFKVFSKKNSVNFNNEGKIDPLQMRGSLNQGYRKVQMVKINSGNKVSKLDFNVNSNIENTWATKISKTINRNCGRMEASRDKKQ